MKIALIGYGKMGHAIEQIAMQRGHEIILRITTANIADMTIENLQKADAIIEFTRPDAAKDNVLKCLEAGVPTVCGTTGWTDDLDIAVKKTKENNTAFLWASNFSIGVNIFFEVNELLASLMNDQPAYEVAIEEAHHTQKKDAPSGTAITLAEQVLAHIKRKTKWVENATGNPLLLPIISYRIENVPGTHSVKYSSSIDDIEITHTAHSREGFAQGAVLAAEYIASKKGVFTMKDVLGISR